MYIIARHLRYARELGVSTITNINSEHFILDLECRKDDVLEEKIH